MALEGFESTIGGKWILLRNERFDDYLGAMGIGYIKRKMACAFTTHMELQKTGDNQIRIITKGPKDSDHTVNLDEPVEEEDPFENMVRAVEISWREYGVNTSLGITDTWRVVPSQATVSWDTLNQVLTTKVEPLTSTGKQSTVTRRIINNELVMQIDLPGDNIVCKRIFKKDAS